MGWKAFKDYFKVEHIVRIEDGILQIGSPYIHDLISIGTTTGKIIDKNLSFKRDFLKNYYSEIKESSPEKILSLLTQEDAFERSIRVYTYDWKTYNILEKYCEDIGYPNVTHDGCLMDDSYFIDRDDAVKQAKKSLNAAIEWRSQRVQELEAELSAARARLEYFESIVIA